MLPQVKRHFPRVSAGAIVAVATLIAGCSREESPEAQVRTVIAAGATSLELAADLKKIVLERELEDDEWRVVRAAW